MDRDVAKSILDLVFDYGGKLNDSMLLVREECDEADFHAYRRAVGEILKTTFAKVIEPIFAEHPDLKPAQLRVDEKEPEDEIAAAARDPINSDDG